MSNDVNSMFIGPYFSIKLKKNLEYKTSRRVSSVYIFTSNEIKAFSQDVNLSCIVLFDKLLTGFKIKKIKTYINQQKSKKCIYLKFYPPLQDHYKIIIINDQIIH